MAEYYQFYPSKKALDSEIGENSQEFGSLSLASWVPGSGDITFSFFPRKGDIGTGNFSFMNQPFNDEEKKEKCDLKKCVFSSVSRTLASSFDLTMNMAYGISYQYSIESDFWIFYQSYKCLPFGGKRIPKKDIYILSEQEFWGRVLSPHSQEGVWVFHPYLQALYFFDEEQGYSEVYIIGEKTVNWSMKAQMYLKAFNQGKKPYFSALVEGFTKAELEDLLVTVDENLENMQ